ncbi:CinA family protein [Falsiroseomonas oryziterrae]|uniref:CinA family protein n=1 Tax=Falsiroseomonas oryziterrae TaxID=2911368 RepID=UPI001F4000B6|nr:nicotinamide-nucleotide amidohydrolase family protein [Roseomonas sp. NPKOSM-4]
MLNPSTLDEAATLLAALQAKGLTLATAESCTGGLIAAALTAIPGSSATVLAGYVTYSNDAKTRLVGVPATMLATHGAVSDPVARQMAEGALADSGADIAVSCTGIAGPSGGSAAKPVGLVFIGCARRGRTTRAERHVFPGDRGAIRAATVDAALALIRRLSE